MAFKKNAPPTRPTFPNHREEQLLRLQSLYGYNAHSLVGISSGAQKWFDFRKQCGLTYTEYGKIRLVAGEMLGADENIESAVRRFVGEARANKNLVAFLPATEKFASLSESKYILTKKILNFSREHFEPIYNFKGLRHFKSKFAPDRWESEYALLPKKFFAAPLVASGSLQIVLRRLSGINFSR